MNSNDYKKIASENSLNSNPSQTFRIFFENFILFTAVISPWIFNANFFWKLCSIPLLSTLMYRSFALFHEAAHGLISSNKNLNFLAGLLTSSLCFLQFDAWKRSHLEHHLWSGNIERDPVMAFINIHPKLSKNFKMVLDLGWKLWIPVLGFIQHVVFWALCLKELRAKPNIKIIISCAYPVFFWAGLVNLMPIEFTFYCVLPASYLYMIGTEIINLPHHLELPFLKENNRYSFAEQYKSARSCVYPKMISKHLVLNFNYHIEHHMFPQAAWYDLENIHFNLKENLAEKYNSDTAFFWIKEARKKQISAILQIKKNNDFISKAS